VSGKISENDGLLSKRWRKCSWGGEQTRCHRRDGLLQNHHSELLEDFHRPYNSKNMVFNVKKLLTLSPAALGQLAQHFFDGKIL
jgi:hypothetical protein